MADTPEAEFYIVDLRRAWSGDPYISLWRPNNANYAWPLPWAGRYNKTTVDEGGAYYAWRESRGGKGRFSRFPVPCAVVEKLATAMPAPGRIDGDAGPVLLNNAETRAALRKARYVPERRA